MPFARQCASLGIEHRLIQPRHPQTSAMAGRFNGGISDLLATTRFRPRVTICKQRLSDICGSTTNTCPSVRLSIRHRCRLYGHGGLRRCDHASA
jgi:transposase InsO family protein